MPDAARPPNRWLVIGGKFRVAQTLWTHDDGSITVQLYRNLDDYDAGRAMEHAFRYRP